MLPYLDFLRVCVLYTIYTSYILLVIDLRNLNIGKLLLSLVARHEIYFDVIIESVVIGYICFRY